MVVVVVVVPMLSYPCHKRVTTTVSGWLRLHTIALCLYNIIRKQLRQHGLTHNTIKDPQWYVAQVSDTTMLPIAASLFGQQKKKITPAKKSATNISDRLKYFLICGLIAL